MAQDVAFQNGARINVWAPRSPYRKVDVQVSVTPEHVQWAYGLVREVFDRAVGEFAFTQRPRPVAVDPTGLVSFELYTNPSKHNVVAQAVRRWLTERFARRNDAARKNKPPRAWKTQRGSTPYPCKGKHVGAEVKRQGKPYKVTACATPKRPRQPPEGYKPRGQYWLEPEGKGNAHAVPKDAVSRALARARKGGPAPDWRARAIRVTPTIASVQVDAPDGTYLVELHRSGEVRVWRGVEGEWVWATGATFHLGAFEWPETFSEDDAVEIERVLLGAPQVRAFLATVRQQLRAGAFRGGEAPAFTFTAARTAHALAGRVGCVKGKGRAEAARLAALAESVACDADPSGPVRSPACRELYAAFERGAPLACEDRSPGVMCNQAVTRSRAEDLRSGAEPMPPLGPYETAVPHSVGGSPCCWYHPDTQARLALRRKVDARAGELTEAAYWQAVQEAEAAHPLSRAWEACDERARREFGPKAEGYRDSFEEQVDRLVALRDQYRQGITPRPADLAAAGIDDDPDYALRAVEDALAQARHERDVTHGRRGVKRKSTGRHRTNPPEVPMKKRKTTAMRLSNMALLHLARLAGHRSFEGLYREAMKHPDPGAWVEHLANLQGLHGPSLHADFDRVMAERAPRGNPRGKTEPPQIVGGKDGLFRVWVPSTGQWLGPFEDFEAAEDAAGDARRPRRRASAPAPVGPTPLELTASVARQREAPTTPAPGTDPSVPYVHRSAAGVRYVWHPGLARFVGPFETDGEAWDRVGAIQAEQRQEAAARRPTRPQAQGQGALSLSSPPPTRGQLGLFGNPFRRRNPTCPKCSGSGRIRGFEHIEGGRCFECGGAGSTQAHRGAPSRPAHGRTTYDALAELRRLYRLAAGRSPTERRDWATSPDEQTREPITALWVGTALALVTDTDRTAAVDAFRGLGLPRVWWSAVAKAEQRTSAKGS